MKKILFLIITIIFVSCDKEEDNPQTEESKTTSSIIVTVLQNNEPVDAGTKVFTDPATVELTTDAFGQVEFEDLKLGKYDVFSFVDGVGSGKSIVNLDKEIERVNVNIIEGNFIGPQVVILKPSYGDGFSAEESIEFSAQISDSHTPMSELSFQWSSNIDGELSGGNINAEGVATLTTDKLSKNEHVVTLSVTNNLGITGSGAVLISTLYPRMIQLELTVNPDKSNKLSWSIEDKDIQNFEVFRYSDYDSSETLIATLDGNAKNYTDSEIPLANEVFYFLKPINNLGNARKSNIVSAAGIPIFNFSALQVEINPNQPLIYLRTDSNKIIGINYQDMSIQVQSDFPGEIGYFSVGNNGYGNELYIPSSDGWIYIYNLSDFSPKESISVGVPVTCIISDKNGLLYTSTRPSPWWEEPLKVYNRNTLSFVDGTGDFDGCRLRMLPSNNEIIEITTTVGPVDMDYYKFDSNGNALIHENDKYHGDHPLDADIYKVSPHNNFLITAKEGAVYTADANMNFIGLLPRGSFDFTDFEFNESGTVIYAGLNSEKIIHLFDSNTLLKIGERKTKGYPYKIFRKGSELIVLSSPTPFQYYYPPTAVSVEKISL